MLEPVITILHIFITNIIIRHNYPGLALNCCCMRDASPHSTLCSEPRRLYWLGKSSKSTPRPFIYPRGCQSLTIKCSLRNFIQLFVEILHNGISIYEEMYHRLNKINKFDFLLDIIFFLIVYQF